MRRIALVIACLLAAHIVLAQDTPRVLIVIAHPDDESTFAATIYKITRELHGVADLFLVTNGEGGYKYSTLAEAYYGKELTDEKVGREFLPQIRKQELQNAGRIIGIRNFTFMDQKDSYYSLDEHEPLDTSWHVPQVQARLRDVLNIGNYDYLFCLLPVQGAHGGHKAATLIALRTVQDMRKGKKPIVLGGSASGKADTVRRFHQLKNYAETRTVADTPFVMFDRTVKFGYKSSLDYHIIVNWEIAEHKSQGTLRMNGGDYEQFWYFAINGPQGMSKTKALFERLKTVPYKTKVY